MIRVIILNKEKYDFIELSILFFILLNANTSTILINQFKGYNTLEIISSIFISLLIGYPLFLLLQKKYSENFKEHIKRKKLKYIIIPMLLISSFIMILFSLYNSSNILKDILLPNTSVKIIMIAVLTISLFLSSKGLKSISIASNLLFIIYIFIIVITVLFNITNIEPINLLPIQEKITKLNIFKIIIITNAPLFLTLIIPTKEIKYLEEFKKNSKKTYIIFYIYLLIKILFMLSILGIKYYKIIKYPEIEVLKSINIFNFFERLEELLIINIFIENFIFVSFGICYIIYFLNDIINTKYLYIFIFITFFILLLNINSLNLNILITSNIIFIIINLLLYKKRMK